ncbi:PadR family transcriptional regulator [Kutzneria kofuensis]|uniref:DNA-binding PadR family transcriptional regulator n=1 Tax=Kutzneria kofuensis TaxID=103725 RepID=A0A7W9NI62_9PSEU|nr:PadR family transcriptional regulator [Kutzneria kofuensis]MBB5892971.1 DNA-binding PadR family transcriptional regulator [Kutzneria kofuensis]
MKRRKVSNPLALAVLAELFAEPMHPYEMGRRLKEQGKDRDIKYNRGSLYMVVEQLTKAGFIAEHETVRDTQRPERTVYAITEAGRTELYDWMRELVATPVHEYPNFGVALSLLVVLPPEETVELLGKRLETLTAQVGEIRDTMRQAQEEGVDWWFLIEEEYRLAQREAERDYVAGLAERLTDPQYQRMWHEYFRGRT